MDSFSYEFGHSLTSCFVRTRGAAHLQQSSEMTNLLEKSLSIMTFTRFLSLLLLAFLISSDYAQQLENMVMGMDYPGISDNCLKVFNITVLNCFRFLLSVSIDNPRLNSKQLRALCTSDCRTALTRVRQIIVSGCNRDTDVVVFDGVVWSGPSGHSYMMIFNWVSTSNEFMANHRCAMI